MRSKIRNISKKSEIKKETSFNFHIGADMNKNNPGYTDKLLYQDDNENLSEDPNVVTGKNVGEKIAPTINIVVEYSNRTNRKGATLGTLKVYHADYNQSQSGKIGNLQGSFPIVSGGRGNLPAPKGEYKNLRKELTATSSNKVLKNPEHGGDANIMIRLPNTNGCAIHQGNNKEAVQDEAYTEGCVAITTIEKKNFDIFRNGKKETITQVDKNYSEFKKLLEPYGYKEGVTINVTIK